MYKAQKAANSTVDVSEHFVDGWTPSPTNGAIENGSWGRRDDHRDAPGADICWDRTGNVQPLNLSKMSEEEKEVCQKAHAVRALLMSQVFTSSVNSTLKPAPANKDGTPREGQNRRTPITQAQNSLNSPSTGRPIGRRRESTDLLNSRDPLSPAVNRFSRDESSISSPPPSLLRRKTDFKDGFGSGIESEKSEANKPMQNSSPFGSLKRTTTNPVGGPSSPWTNNAPQSAGFAPMGAFGNFGVVEGSSERRPPFASGRSESRFKDLMYPSSSDKADASIKEKASQGHLAALAESFQEPKGESRALENDRIPTGSAALGGDDASPPLPSSARFRGQDQQSSYEDIGFSSVGPDMPFRDLMQRREYPHQQLPQHGPGAFPPQSHEPMSPTHTNPYQSPEGEKAVPNDHDEHFRLNHFNGNSAFGQPSRNLQNHFDSHDRGTRPFSGGLGGLGSLGGLEV